LALELAAVKVRFLDPATLLSRLDRALSTAWGRDLPERQRTMRAALDWSHDLLSGPERGLFRRLSVFAGGFTIEGAEAVGGDPEDVLELLGGLVEQSLVVADGGQRGPVRYRMLEPVRQYALQRLEESGEAGVSGGTTRTSTERSPKPRRRNFGGPDKWSGSISWTATTTTCGSP
jgi:predicted ATPase